MLLAYRGNSVRGNQGGIGVARAPHWRGPYEALLDEPLFNGYAEDPTLFIKNGIIHMVAHGELGGDLRGSVGIHAVSVDGIAWSPPQSAYTLYVEWAQSIPEPRPQLGRREAPQVLMSRDGSKLVALYNAAMPCKCGYGNRAAHCNWGEACRSFSMVCGFHSQPHSIESVH